MDLTNIRRLVVAAVFSDDQLVERLVLKGGNALEIVHGVISRGSIDIDLSMEGDFDDLDDFRARIFRSIRTSFDAAGYVTFDERIREVPGPSNSGVPWWGGYQVEFKFIDKSLYENLEGRIDDIRRQAHTIDTRQGRRFRIDISKHEFCDGKEAVHVGGRTVYVYSAAMCAIEKLRAICQQEPEYSPVPQKTRKPRGRDFYDIYAIVTRLGVDLSLPENLDLVRSIFAAKHVPLSLLGSIRESREFHRQDWPAVQDDLVGETFEFDFYFDFALDEISKLESLWIE